MGLHVSKLGCVTNSLFAPSIPFYFILFVKCYSLRMNCVFLLSLLLRRQKQNFDLNKIQNHCIICGVYLEK